MLYLHTVLLSAGLPPFLCPQCLPVEEPSMLVKQVENRQSSLTTNSFTVARRMGGLATQTMVLEPAAFTSSRSLYLISGSTESS